MTGILTVTAGSVYRVEVGGAGRTLTHPPPSLAAATTGVATTAAMTRATSARAVEEALRTCAPRAALSVTASSWLEVVAAAVRRTRLPYSLPSSAVQVGTAGPRARQETPASRTPLAEEAAALEPLPPSTAAGPEVRKPTQPGTDGELVKAALAETFSPPLRIARPGAVAVAVSTAAAAAGVDLSPSSPHSLGRGGGPGGGGGGSSAVLVPAVSSSVIEGANQGHGKLAPSPTPCRACLRHRSRSRPHRGWSPSAADRRSTR